MKLEHIALSISDHKEIERFYKKVLGMKQIKNFVLKRELTASIFEIDEEIDVFLLQKDNLIFEIFITTVFSRQTFNHICFSINNRERFVNKIIKSGYKVLRVEREFFDLIFIRDQDGNIFEIKEM
jgi:catechol 2,3-dioxygenase-like lactoylglutathione lyase family enzyme